jgi:cyclase
MPLTIGGGVRTIEDIRKLLLAGADKVSINTAAVRDPDFVRRSGGEVRQPVHRRRHRRQAGGEARWEIFTHGGREPTGIDAIDLRQTGHRDRRRRDPADLDGPRRHQAPATTCR